MAAGANSPKDAASEATAAETRAASKDGASSVSSVTGDLLWLTAATVGVSSRVANPRDIPNHIADHNADTAWNGKTGDLVGAWIKFRVPGDSAVSHVMLSAGFDKKSDKEDLFTANYRISKVRISRAGKVIRASVDLDPNNRAPQKIEINDKGGDYTIDVLAVVPGTHAGWKELTVSELAVMGTSSKPRKGGAASPNVLVGGLDVTEAPFSEVHGDTYDAACMKMVEDEKLATAEYIALQKPDETSDPSCSVAKDKISRRDPAGAAGAGGAIVETAHAAWENASVGFGREHFNGEVLAFRTSKYVAVTSIRVSGTAWTVNPTTEYKLRSEKWEGGDFVVDVEATTTTSEDGMVPPEEEDAGGVDHGPWISKEMLHTVCSGERLSCATTVVR